MNKTKIPTVMEFYFQEKIGIDRSLFRNLFHSFIPPDLIWKPLPPRTALTSQMGQFQALPEAQKECAASASLPHPQKSQELLAIQFSPSLDSNQSKSLGVLHPTSCIGLHCLPGLLLTERLPNLLQPAQCTIRDVLTPNPQKVINIQSTDLGNIKVHLAS